MSAEILFLIIFQILLTVILLRISGEIGRLSLSRGYSSMTNVHAGGNLSFNLFYRVLYLPISLCVVAIFLYFLQLDFLTINIWLVSIWYFGLQLSLSLNKLPYTKLDLYFGSALFSILVTYIFYIYGISRGLSGLLPDPSNFRTELWFIIFLFFYGLLNSYRIDDNQGGYRKKLENTYLKFKKKYYSFLNQEFQEIKILNDLLFSIMIFEDMNRPKWFRLLEKVLFKIGLSKTTGIMQIRSSKLFNDEDSVREAQKIILTNYKDYKNLNEYELVGRVITAYNPDAYYRDEVRKIFWDIQGISNFLEENKFSKADTGILGNNDLNVKEIQAQISALISQIEELKREMGE